MKPLCIAEKFSPYCSNYSEYCRQIGSQHLLYPRRAKPPPPSQSKFPVPNFHVGRSGFLVGLAEVKCRRRQLAGLRERCVGHLVHGTRSKSPRADFSIHAPVLSRLRRRHDHELPAIAQALFAVSNFSPEKPASPDHFLEGCGTDDSTDKAISLSPTKMKLQFPPTHHWQTLPRHRIEPRAIQGPANNAFNLQYTEPILTERRGYSRWTYVVWTPEDGAGSSANRPACGLPKRSTQPRTSQPSSALYWKMNSTSSKQSLPSLSVPTPSLLTTLWIWDPGYK